MTDILKAAKFVAANGRQAFEAEYPDLDKEIYNRVCNEGAAILWNEGNGAGAFELGDYKKALIVIPKVEEPQVFIDSNPKTAFGAVKPGTFNTPPIPLYEYSLAHYQGALKYGHYNWREDPVSISTYINAARRHIDLYLEGQKEASDTGIHNLAHAMTCLSIVIDAEWYGTLIDDRAPEQVRAYQKMEEYFESKKPLQQKIMKDWSGHAAKLKAKLAVNKEVK